jgi:hypothetical protein
MKLGRASLWAVIEVNYLVAGPASVGEQQCEGGTGGRESATPESD